ncbi:subtilisin-like protein [Lactarius psammicola]|nr:subtilisin-like protein [Lactarius psammicola]
MPVLYYLLSVLSIIAAGPLGSLATPPTRPWGGMTVKHAWDAVPENWESLGHPSAGTTIDLYLALKPHHEDALTDALDEISNPRDPNYGAYLSKEQVAQLVAPHPDTLELVNRWLEDHDVPSSSVSTALGGDWLVVIGVPLLQANDILGASYQLYQHLETNDTVLRTVSYSLPQALHGHVQTVVPTTYFGSPRTQGKKRYVAPRGVAQPPETAGSGESEVVSPTPAYVRWLYKTMGYVPAAVDKNALGVVGFNKQYPDTRDLWIFMKEYRTDGEDATFSVERIKGAGYDPSDGGIEANLNVQFAEAVAYPTRIIFYSTAGDKPDTANDPYVNWLDYVLEQETIPQTISVSYGGYEYNFPPEYADKLCKTLAKLGARGVSVLFASGDWGVGEGNCLVRDEYGHVSVRFLPIFPASCPYVTSVGGTTSIKPEVEVEVAAKISGGGFSNYFPRPRYQANVVPTFLEKLGEKYDGLYNPDGRGLPDVAAQALNFEVILNGKRVYRDGTSGAAPIVAGVVSLLNDYLLSKGKSPLGFLNPWLYSDGIAGLKDIMSGSSQGCGTEGFSAVSGWDPVTGLGTPDFDKLEEIIDDREWNSRAPDATIN